eukprot:6748394-Prymnesium_polylepis.1
MLGSGWPGSTFPGAVLRMRARAERGAMGRNIRASRYSDIVGCARSELGEAFELVDVVSVLSKPKHTAIDR